MQQLFFPGYALSAAVQQRVREMQTVVAIMLIGSVVMVAIAALDQPHG